MAFQTDAFQGTAFQWEIVVLASKVVTMIQLSGVGRDQSWARRKYSLGRDQDSYTLGRRQDSYTLGNYSW